MDSERLKSALEALFTPSPAVFILGAIIVVLFPVVLHYLLTRATPYTSLPSVLLAGPSGSGKTALLTLFERGAHPQQDKAASAAALTHTSQQPSAVELSVSEDGSSSFRDDLDAAGATAKKFLLVDTPGHGKLRGHAMSKLAPPSQSTRQAATKLKAVVFVIDAAALSEPEALASAAEYLYDALLALQKRASSSKSSRTGGGIPVLVAANKLDLFTALPAALVKSYLEAELGRIRRTRSKGLLDSGVGGDEVGAGGDESDDWLGEYGSEKFGFAQMREFDIDVDVVGGNIVGDGPGVDKWWSWISDKI